MAIPLPEGGVIRRKVLGDSNKLVETYVTFVLIFIIVVFPPKARATLLSLVASRLINRDVCYVDAEVFMYS